MALCVRLAAVEAPVGQIVFWRSAVALVPICIYLAFAGQFPRALRTANLAGHAVRGAYGCAAMFFSFLSLALLPLSLATALSFVAPLITIPLAVVALKERPGTLPIFGAGLGFAGVGLMLAPAFQGTETDLATLLGVGAGLACAATTASAKVAIKRLTETEAPGAIAFYFAALCALAGLATLPLGWVEARGETLLWLSGAGLFGGFAHIAMTEAVARAPISTLAPFEYTAMLWAAGFDAAVFAQFPSSAGLAGAVLVVSASALVVWGERRRAGAG